MEELTQLVRTDQLGQHPTIEGEGLGASFGDRRVALVHVRRDVVE